MSSQPTSSSAARSAESSRQRLSNPVWDNWPSISIMLPPQGKCAFGTTDPPLLTPTNGLATGVNNRQVDQRCFTYCSQTVRGRAQQQEPRCRSLCIRKVFRHEVRRAMTMHELQDTIRAYEREHSKLPEKIDASVPVKYKLPVEGQLRPNRNSGPSSLQDVSNVDAGEDPPSPSRHERSSSSDNDEDKVRYWEPGWYLWSTTSRWAAQEQMDMMSRDLKWQSDWQRYKDNVNDDYRRRQGQDEGGVDDERKEEVQGPRIRQSFPDLTCARVLLFETRSLILICLCFFAVKTLGLFLCHRLICCLVAQSRTTLPPPSSSWPLFMERLTTGDSRSCARDCGRRRRPVNHGRSPTQRCARCGRS